MSQHDNPTIATHPDLVLVYRAQYEELLGEHRIANADNATLTERSRDLQDRLEKAQASADMHKRAYESLQFDYDRTCQELERTKDQLHTRTKQTTAAK